MSIQMETDIQNLLRGATTLGNLCHSNEEAYAQVMSFGFKFPAKTSLVIPDTEKDVDKNWQTINEIANMLGVEFA